MQHTNALFDEWQRRVQEYEEMMRNGRMSGLSSEELNLVGRAYLSRIDAAYGRLRCAEGRVPDSGFQPLAP